MTEVNIPVSVSNRKASSGEKDDFVVKTQSQELIVSHSSGHVDEESLTKQSLNSAEQIEEELENWDVDNGEDVQDEHLLQVHENTPKRVEKHLHCLNSFYTKPEKLALDNPQALLSISGNYLFVVSNRATPGQTLFRSLGHAITGEEQDHFRIRKIVTNYVVSEDGWTILRKHVIPFYQYFIDEFSALLKHTKDLGKDDDILRTAYQHYFISDEMEGSLIELVAASILYNFSYTCFFKQESEDPPKGKSLFRIAHSFYDREDLEEKPRYFFLRVGESPQTWKWNCLAACHRGDVRSIKIPRGTHRCQLWHMHTFEWSRPPLRKMYLISPSQIFQWENGISVIATKNELLGGYTTLGFDLFSNLCWLLYGHFDFYSLLRNSVSTCELSHPLLFFTPFKKSKTLATHVEKCSVVPSVGTVEELHKASIICKFGYQVIGINENGELHNLAMFRPRGRQIRYFLARTEKGVVTKWCALDNMLANPNNDGSNRDEMYFKDIRLFPVREPYTEIRRGPLGIRYRKDYGTKDPWQDKNVESGAYDKKNYDGTGSALIFSGGMKQVKSRKDSRVRKISNIFGSSIFKSKRSNQVSSLA